MDGGNWLRFLVFMDLGFVSVQKHAKRERGLIIWHSKPSRRLVFLVLCLTVFIAKYWKHVRETPTSFPGSLFSASLSHWFQRLREEEKRDPGNKVGETQPQFCLLCFRSRWRFRFSRFLIPSGQRTDRKYFYCHAEYFAKENFRAQVRTSAKSYCGNKTGGVANNRDLVHLVGSRSLPYMNVQAGTE